LSFSGALEGGKLTAPFMHKNNEGTDASTPRKNV
jgi:hypothetical protein